MKKAGLMLLFSFLMFGVIIGNFVIAEDGISNSGSGSDDPDPVITSSDDSDVIRSNSGSDDDLNKSDDDDSIETEVELEIESKSDDDNLEERDRIRIREREGEKEFRRVVKTEDGKTIVIERKVEINNEEIKITITRKITDSDGSVKLIKILIIVDDEGVKKEIKMEGETEIEIETELEVDDDYDGNETYLGVFLSNGSRADIKIMPDEASEIALERLRAKNFTVELREEKERNIPRVVYNIEADKSGKFLGVFKLALKVEGQVDPETGEFIGISKPWWAFLVTGEDSDETEEGNETNSSS